MAATVFPTVHRNGDTRETLLKQQMDVLEAFHTLENAMGAAYPNGRNFYPQGSNAMHQAMAEEDARWKAIRAVKAEYQAIAEKLVEH